MIIIINVIEQNNIIIDDLSFFLNRIWPYHVLYMKEMMKTSDEKNPI